MPFDNFHPIAKLPSLLAVRYCGFPERQRVTNAVAALRDAISSLPGSRNFTIGFIEQSATKPQAAQEPFTHSGINVQFDRKSSTWRAWLEFYALFAEGTSPEEALTNLVDLYETDRRERDAEAARSAESLAGRLSA